MSSDPSFLAHRSLAALLAVATAACASTGAPAPARREGMTAAPPAAWAQPAVKQPRVVATGTNGVLDATLEVVLDSVQVPVTSSTSSNQLLRAYRLVSANGVQINDPPSFPGPTFMVSPGDSVRIRLINSLPPSDNGACMSYPATQSGADVYPDCFHGPTWTNLHYHGFHVSPEEPADDVLIDVAPGDSFQFAFRIPQNQSPGTHWYHPHKHGSVAIQVSNGMSGAFIVRGGALDRMTDSLDIEEVMLAIQKVDSQLNLVDAGLNAVTVVNGQMTPTIVMRPGEVQRWRIVNENITRTSNFQVGFVNAAGQDEPSLWDIARDGVQYAPVNYDVANPDTLLLMAPGNRLDVFVKAPMTPGLHRLELEGVAPPSRMGSRNREGAASASPKDTLWYVQVVNDGKPVQTQLPAALPPLPGFLANLPGPLDPALIDTSAIPVIVFADSTPTGRSQSNPSRFFLGSVADPRAQFDPSSVFIPTSAGGDSLPMVLGQLQTWMVVNNGSTTNHPFHIHINPFQVIDVVYPRGAADPNAAFYQQLETAAQTNQAPIWLDVVPLPLPLVSGGVVTQPGYIIIRQQYADFAGQYVMHCHILGHEERGMMQLLQVFGPDQARAAGGAHRH